MSRLTHLLRAAADTPWAIVPAKLEAIAAVLEIRGNGGAYTDDDILARLGGEAGAPAKAAIGRGVAVLPLYGVISPRMDALSETSGGTSTERFAAWFDAALGNDEVSAIVIDVDSPGGAVQGVDELAHRILAARGQKPITAVVNHLGASAAYWIASCADEIVVTPSAEVGSIGVIALYADTSEADAKEGVKVTVLSAGKYKAEGVYGPLSEDAQAAMQGRIASYYAMMTQTIAKGRAVSVDTVRTGFGQGRVVSATEAVKAGMADRVGSLESVVSKYMTGRGSVKALPARRAAVVPARIAALLAGPLTDPLDVAALALIAPVLLAAVPEDPAPVVVPVLIPAPVAKEHPMPDLDVAAADAATQVKAAQEANQTRLAALSALATEHPQYADLPGWLKAGTSAETAKDQILAKIKAVHAAAPIVRNGTGHIVSMGEGPADKPFRTLGEQMSSIIAAGRQGAAVDSRLLKINAAVTGSSEGIGSEGGFAVQEDFIPGILEPVYSTGEVAKRVTKLPVGPNANGVKFNVVDETSRATGSRWGGIQMAWGTEGSQGTNTKAKLRPVELNLKKLIGLYPMTDELLEDAVAMQALLEKGFQTELQFMVEDSFISGTGAGQPLGILNSGALVTQAIEAAQTILNSPASIVANVSKMKSRFPASLWGGAVWLANQELEPTFVLATLGGTAAAFPVYMPSGGLSGAPYSSILGKPLIFVDYCPAVGTPGDLILTNLGEYASIDKGGVESASSIHLRFDFDETVFRITYRVDGQPIWKQAVTPFKGSLTRSPFVVLGTRV